MLVAQPARRRRAARSRLPPRETPAVAGFQSFARFESIVLAENQQRFSTLTWQPLLWGGGMLVRTWGRLGTPGISLATPFADRDSAQEAVTRLVRRRLQRRYELIDWQ
jgi:predicted DNA-binding WGR domain protein